MVIALLEPLEIAGKTITADALLTQRKLAQYLLARNADYVFTVKGNQPTLHEDIRLIFEGRTTPDFTEPLTLAHGRIEQRSIWTSTAGQVDAHELDHALFAKLFHWSAPLPRCRRRLLNASIVPTSGRLEERGGPSH